MCGNMKFISSVDKDILFNVENYIHIFMQACIHVLFCLLYSYIKNIILLPHKNRAINSNAFHDNHIMKYNHTCDYVSGRNINKTLYIFKNNNLDC